MSIEETNTIDYISIYFNNPFEIEIEKEIEEGEEVIAQDDDKINAVDYNLILKVPISDINTTTLFSLRDKIADCIIQSNPSISKDDITSFYFKPNATSSQLKDESKTLHDLEIRDQGILHLQVGEGCKDGEFILHFELELIKSDATTSAYTLTQTYTSLGDLAVSEKSSISQLKSLLFNNWENFSISALSFLEETENTFPDAPTSSKHLRLRDFKGGKLSGPLRDDRLIGLTDGRKLVVQVLQEEEHIATDDIIVAVKLVTYMDTNGQSCNGCVTSAIDVPMQRTSTIKQLYERLYQMFPQFQNVTYNNNSPELSGLTSLSEDTEVEDFSETVPESKFIGVAKGFSTGPSLTVKSSLKLKFNDPMTLKEAAAKILDRPPLNLRDGSLIVVRGQADYMQAAVIMKAKKSQMVAENNSRPVSRGAGASAVRARLRAKQESSGDDIAKFSDSRTIDNNNNNDIQPTVNAIVLPLNSSDVSSLEIKTEKVPSIPSPVHNNNNSNGETNISPNKSVGLTTENGSSPTTVAVTDDINDSNGVLLPPPQKSPRKESLETITNPVEA